MSSFGDRLKEERERLGLSQTVFAERAGTTRKTQFNYETNARRPDTDYIALAIEIGVDVAYVLTGNRGFEAPSLDAAESALLDSYRRCSADAKIHLIQTAALLSAGLGSGSQAQASAKSAGMTNQSQNQVHIGNHGVQIGNGSGRVTIKRGK